MTAVWMGHRPCELFLGWAWLLSLTPTAAVQLSEQLSEQYVRHNGTSEVVTVGEFEFCVRPRSSHAPSVLSMCGDTARLGLGFSWLHLLGVPEYVEPSATAIAVGVVKAFQWLMGWNTDWLNACFATTSYEVDAKCKCSPTRKPKTADVVWHITKTVMMHPLTTIVFLAGLQSDIYTRTKVIDEIMRKAINERSVDQMVLLGAGFDTRPYRTGAGLAKVPKVFETDLLEGHRLKMSILRKCGVRPLQGDGQVVYDHLNLLEDDPFEHLWGNAEFKPSGHTLFMAEQVFGYLDLMSNMNWIRVLGEKVRQTANASATLILVSSRGLNFDMNLSPRCYSKEECIRSQMPLEKDRSTAFMRALGWELLEEYDPVGKPYYDLAIDGAEIMSFVGVFAAHGGGSGNLLGKV